MHVDAVGGGAGLAQIAHLGQHRAFDGGVHVGIVEDDDGRVAAQLHRWFQTWSAAPFSSFDRRRWSR